MSEGGSGWVREWVSKRGRKCVCKCACTCVVVEVIEDPVMIGVWEYGQYGAKLVSE